MEARSVLGQIRARLPARPRHFAGVLEQFGDRDGFEFAARALAREVLDAADDVGAVFGALDDQFEAGFDFGGVGAVAEDELGAAEYAGEGVVNVVGDAEGEFAEGGHLLGVDFLLALGDVTRVSLSDFPRHLRSRSRVACCCELARSWFACAPISLRSSSGS